MDNVIPVIKTITWLLLSRLQGNKPHRNSPEPSEPCLRNLHQHTPELSGTVRNLPEPPSGTCSCDPHRHTPELIWAIQAPLAYAVGENKFMRYPQQLGRSWRVFGYLPWNSREPHQLSAPEPSRTLSAICAGNLRNLVYYLHRDSPEPHQPFAPGPSGTSSAICTRTARTLRKAICTRTLQNLISPLHRNPPPHHLSAQNPPEPHQPSAPEPSGTSSAICTGTLRNFISHLHRKAPEPSGTFSGTWCCSCTGSHQSYSGLKTP